MLSSKTSQTPSHRFAHAAASNGIDLYLFGGTQEEDIAGRVELSDFMIFDGLRKKWKRADVQFGGTNLTLEHRQKSGFPSERSSHTLIIRHKKHQPKLRLNPQHKLIVFGGVRTISNALSDIWEWDFTTHRWRQIVLERHDTYGDETETDFRFSPLIGEPKRKHFYSSGKGSSSSSASPRSTDGTLALPSGNLATILPPPEKRSNYNPEKTIGKVFGHSCVYYEPWDAMLTYGGWRSSEIYGLFFRTLKPDMEWKWALARWKHICRSSDLLHDRYRQSPVARRFQTMVLYKRNLVIFGGRDYQNTDRNDLWIFSLKRRVWQEIDSYGDVPPPTSNHASCLAFERPEMIVFGGTNGSPHLFKFNFKTRLWSRIRWLSEIHPAPRVAHTMNCLNNGDIVLVGGHRSYQDRAAESWVLRNGFESNFQHNLFHTRDLFIDMELKFLVDDRGLQMQKDTSDEEEIRRCSQIIDRLKAKRLKREGRY